MNTVDVNNYPSLLTYLKSKLKELVQTTSLFLEILLLPRDGYIRVSKENIQYKYVQKPVITGQMVRYVTRNILGEVSDVHPVYTSNYNSLFSSTESNSSEYDYVEYFYVTNMKPEFKEYLSSLLSNENNIVEYINESGKEETLKYLDHLLNSIIKSEEDLERVDELIDELPYEGDNAANPKSYGFIDENDNILMGSLVWVFCGLEDWLESNVIQQDDIDIAVQIILSERLKKEYSSFLVSKVDDVSKEALRKHLIDAFYTNGLFLTNKSIEKLIHVFYNLRNPKKKDKQVIDVRIRRFSYVI